MNEKKVLIIGGTGFIGYHVAKLCSKNYKTTSLSLSIPNKNRKCENVKYIICDISKKSDLEKKIKDKFDIIVNLGGYINHTNKNLAIKTHFKGCQNLVNFFSDKKIKIFIQIGSSTEYGKQKSPNIENNNGKPKTIYAQSKLNATKYLSKFSKKNNFPIVILRFYQIYGPNQNKDRLVPMVIESSLNDDTFNCSSGIQGKDFMYISDAVDAIYKCFSNKKIIGKIINIGSGKKITVKRLILKIVKKVNAGKPIFGILGMRSDEPKNSYPNIMKAKNYLFWTPKVAIEKGLSKTINFYKKQKKYDK
jgi:UDP-glucose 4-epimerase|tara:strand:- start:412 stop:1326 length:915 start_codon:yes stop_codon:yes gene_type:complete